MLAETFSNVLGEKLKARLTKAASTLCADLMIRVDDDHFAQAVGISLRKASAEVSRIAAAAKDFFLSKVLICSVVT